MENPPKCLLLPIDGTSESLRPVEFVARLYPGVRNVNLILSYFVPPLPPIYKEAGRETPEMLKKRREVLALREQDTRRVFESAGNMLTAVGFSPKLIQEHIQQKEMTVAKHACLLAEIKKVDAILVQKRVSSSLEGFLKGDSPAALLRHCLASPIWFTEGEIDTGKAAISVCNEDASLKIADHAGFMLSEAACAITLLHVTKSVSSPVFCPFTEVSKKLSAWSAGAAGLEVMPYIQKSAAVMIENGVDEGRISVSLVPHRGDTAHEILSWCASNGVSIIAVGHSQPVGIWSFLKASVTRKILANFKNMAVLVAQ